ncbi:MAG: DUF167 family protein [Gemmatimonadota bacterium]|nr:DUF167 family protein [Candidatus Palauibacterales bacterium]
MIWIEEREGALRFKVRVLTRASRTEIAGVHGDALKIRLAASPVEGAANAELITLLAKQLRLPKSAISIVRGLKGRDKVLEAAGATRDQLRGLI